MQRQHACSAAAVVGTVGLTLATAIYISFAKGLLIGGLSCALILAGFFTIRAIAVRVAGGRN